MRKAASLWLGIALSLFVHAKVKNVLLIVSDDLKADALACYGNKVAETPSIDQLARKAPSSGTPIARAPSAALPGQLHAGTLPWRQANYLGGTFSKERLFEYPGRQDLPYARPRRRHRRDRWGRRPGLLVDQVQHARQGGSYARQLRLPEPQQVHHRSEGASIHQDALPDVRHGRLHRGRVRSAGLEGGHQIGGAAEGAEPGRKALLPGHRNGSSSLPQRRPRTVLCRYPYKRMQLPHVPEGDWDDMPKAGISASIPKSSVSTSFRTTRSACGPATSPPLPSWTSR